MFISFDTPHKGANIPVGIQKLAEDIDDIDIVELFNLNEGELASQLYASNTPAAKQMLLRYKGPDPDPLFNQLQSELAALGWPTQCRNIALVNGSRIAAKQMPPDFNPGDQIFEASAFSGFVNGKIKVRTNDLNSSTKVSSVVIFFTAIPVTIKEKTYYFDDKGWDVAPGGLLHTQGAITGALDNAIGAWALPLAFFGVGWTNFGRDAHCFVPVVSALDLPAGTDPFYFNDGSIINKQYLVTNNITPFDDIYAQGMNSEHVETGPISSLLEIIYEQEVMRTTIALQNRIIKHDRDFEAPEQILAGSSVQPLTWNNKLVDQGNFVIDGAHVNFESATAVHLLPGFEVKNGATYSVKIKPNTGCSTPQPAALAPPAIISSSVFCDYNTVQLAATSVSSYFPVVTHGLLILVIINYLGSMQQ